MTKLESFKDLQSRATSARNICVIQWLLAICRNLDINPRLYLNSVIEAMPYFEKASEDELRVLVATQVEGVPSRSNHDNSGATARKEIPTTNDIVGYNQYKL